MSYREQLRTTFFFTKSRFIFLLIFSVDILFYDKFRIVGNIAIVCFFVALILDVLICKYKIRIDWNLIIILFICAFMVLLESVIILLQSADLDLMFGRFKNSILIFVIPLMFFIDRDFLLPKLKYFQIFFGFGAFFIGLFAVGVYYFPMLLEFLPFHIPNSNDPERISLIAFGFSHHFLAFTIFIGLCFFLALATSKQNIQRYIYLGLSFLSYSLIVLVHSRSIIIIASIYLVLLVLVQIRKSTFLLPLLFFIFAGIILLYYTNNTFNSSFIRTIDEIQYVLKTNAVDVQNLGNISMRIIANVKSYALIQSSPFLGHGVEKWVDVYNSFKHDSNLSFTVDLPANQFLIFCLQFGLIYTAIFSFFLIAMIFFSIRTPIFCTSLVCVLLYFLSESQFSAIQGYVTIIFYILMLFLFEQARITRKNLHNC